jgi:hypothetical protein
MTKKSIKKRIIGVKISRLIRLYEEKLGALCVLINCINEKLRIVKIAIVIPTDGNHIFLKIEYLLSVKFLSSFNTNIKIKVAEALG